MSWRSRRRFDLIAKKAIELRKKGVAKDQIRAQIQAEVPEMAPWMMTGLVNDMRLDAFYNELSAARNPSSSASPSSRSHEEHEAFTEIPKRIFVVFVSFVKRSRW